MPRDAWNRLAGLDNPFMRHEFLSALERHGCVSEQTGWVPNHLVVSAGEEPVGVMPMYVKYHSYGEFVFDWGWADAYERAGMTYYPKLVVAAPFTPAMGRRLLYQRDSTGADTAKLLVAAAVELAQQAEVSSLHWLFTVPEDTQVLADSGLLVRTGYQFHWRNPGYRDFQDYLDSLTSKKRKQIRRERRDAGRAPVTVEVLRGPEISASQWDAYHRLYASTYDRKWGMPSLSAGFFQEVGETMPESTMLILARRGRRYIAGAHLFAGHDTLYGRNWGCSEYHPALHFEICYYRTIEFCIEQGLHRFEAGAQGEHKLSRGFLPIATHSAHWIRHPEFRRAIETFLGRERAGVDHYLGELEGHSPFRCDSGPAPER